VFSENAARWDYLFVAHPRVISAVVANPSSQTEPYLWCGLIALLSGRFSDAHAAYTKAADGIEKLDAQVAVRDLEYWTARNARHLESPEAHRALDAIRKLLGEHS
jgi:hypothetical protein